MNNNSNLDERGEGEHQLTTAEPSTDTPVPESTELSRVMNARTITLNPPLAAGSPIARQPVTNLALICRYLAPKELLAIDKTCRLLSQAASHPLTFQQETEVGVEHDLYHCRSYARGPVGIFGRDASKLRRALKSRLFKHFRIIELRCGQLEPGADSDEDLHQTLVGWFNCLIEDATTPIKALTIEIHCNSTKMSPTGGLIESRYFQPSVFETWSQSKSMAYLALLHLRVDEGLLTVLKYLPPSVRILHLTLTNFNCSMTSIVEGILGSPARTHLKQVIFDTPPELDEFASTDLNDLILLNQLSRDQTNIEAIHWCIKIDIGDDFEVVKSMKLPLISTIYLRFPYGWKPTPSNHTMFEQLAIFTDLKQLIFTGFTPQPPPSDFCNRCKWPSTVLESIESIRVAGPLVGGFTECFFAKAVFPHLRTLVLDRDMTVFKLLLSSPHVTSLSMDSLYDIGASIPDAALHQIRAAFPSLTELQLKHSPCSGTSDAPPTRFIFEIPHLKRIRWMKLKWMTPTEAKEQIMKEFEEKRRAFQLYQSKRQIQPATTAFGVSPATGQPISSITSFIPTPVSGNPLATFSLTSSMANLQPFTLANDSSTTPTMTDATNTLHATIPISSTNPFTLEHSTSTTTATTTGVAMGESSFGSTVTNSQSSSSTGRPILFTRAGKKVNGKKTNIGTNTNTSNTPSPIHPTTRSPTITNTPSNAFSTPPQVDDVGMNSVAVPISLTNPFTFAPITFGGTENNLSLFTNPFLTPTTTSSDP